MHKPSIYIGTSGYSYKHWIGTFYPAGTKASKQLDEYLKTFHTVEVNYSFYKMPEPSTLHKWKEQVPEDFIFSLKANKYITHNKKLNNVIETTLEFFHRADILKEKLGPILFQLPPKWNINVDRLRYFLTSLPKGYRCVFEFRNQTWYTQEVYDLLQKYNCAFCLYELDRHLSPLEITADFVYIRLHGPEGKYAGSYTDAMLKDWAKKCKKWIKEGKDVYIYFDNDQLGYAGFNAQTLKTLILK